MENNVRKGEIACNMQFLTVFSTLYDTYFSFQMHFKMSAICFNLDQSKILSSCKELSPLLPEHGSIILPTLLGYTSLF